MENKNYWWARGIKYEEITRFIYKGREFIVCDDYDGYFEIFTEQELQRYEDTYRYKQQKKQEEKLNELIKKEQELVNKYKKEAVEKLKSRMILNMAFSKDGKGFSDIGLLMVKALEGLIEKDK